MRQISYPKPTLKALLFIGLYRLVCVFVWVISLPFLFFAQTKTKYHLSIPARFFPFHIEDQTDDIEKSFKITK